MGTSTMNSGPAGMEVTYYERTQRVEQGKTTKTHGADYGRTVGDPKLSEEGQKYYEKLKKKFGNMEFILVSKDQKEAAEANAARYANASKPVVLIDEEKIEKMAKDENYRKKYEGIIRGATTQLETMKNKLGDKVSAFGVKINDGGNASFFAVVDKSMAAQRERISKKAEQKVKDARAERKEEARKMQEKHLEASREKHRKNADDAKETSWSGDQYDLDAVEHDNVTVTASSVEELFQKVEDTIFAAMSDGVETEAEKGLGRHIDFSL